MSSLYDIYVVDFCHSPTAMTRTKYYDVDDNDDDENNADGHGHQRCLWMGNGFVSRNCRNLVSMIIIVIITIISEHWHFCL